MCDLLKKERLLEYIKNNFSEEDVESLLLEYELTVCDKCGSIFKYEDEIRARYDYNKIICPSCSIDGA